ncbi:hypothetical protein E2C01_077046 [Portunus trituberculatus]|uniref:Uncharacterized protein n=1 Tax=Portunus trituberculatus TaxID=210409 RepID=A0A5B7IES5_PORTR|nr:hypothetical protein [Portunus trituberculatus]
MKSFSESGDPIQRVAAPSDAAPKH